MRYLLIFLLLLSCKSKEIVREEVYDFPVKEADTIKDIHHVSFDKDITKDGTGSLRIEVSSPTTIELLKIKNPKVENALVICEAMLKAEDVKGMAYLDIEYRIPNKGLFFAKGYKNPSTGTHGWVKKTVKFRLAKNESPEYINIRVSFTGSGRLWVDNIKIYKEIKK